MIVPDLFTPLFDMAPEGGSVCIIMCVNLPATYECAIHSLVHSSRLLLLILAFSSVNRVQ